MIFDISRFACAALLGATAGSAAAVEFDCVIEARRVVAISGPIEALIAAVRVDRGDTVRKGDVLVEFEAGVERATAELAQSRAAMQSAIAKWSDCMHAVGYDLAEPEQVDVLLQRRLDAIVGPANNRRTDYDKAALAALQRDEVAMVASDTDCEKKNIQKVEDVVRAEYEKAFREENAALLGTVVKP